MAMVDKHPHVCWARMARVEKDTMGQILAGQIEVNRSPVPTTQRLVKPRGYYTGIYTTTGMSFDMVFVWFHTQWVPTNPCLVKSRSLGRLISVLRLYMAPLDTSHALL